MKKKFKKKKNLEKFAVRIVISERNTYDEPPN